MARRYTAQEALERILALNAEESGDDSSNESVEDQHEQLPNVIQSSSDEEEEEEAHVVNPTADGRDGTRWQIVDRPHIGRAEQQNVFTGRQGLTRYANAIQTPLDAWRLLIDEGCIRHIVRCTNDFALSRDPAFCRLQEEELEHFVGLLYLRGTMNQRTFPLEALWSVSTGCPAFNRCMSRNRMRLVKKYLRFDIRETRRQALQHDKFALISTVFNRFVKNSIKSYCPGASLTVDEQLFPTKARCPFTQYMANKPDKFGVKFWILAEVESKYCVNAIPYLGADEQRNLPLGTHVVLSLMEPFLGKGYNVTTDNFFTNKDLAQRLLQQRTTITGTVRANRRELPPPKTLALHDSVFFQFEDIHLTRYQAKRNKVVHVMSSQHKGNATQPEGKKKPHSILNYNANKFGVDVLDSMCRQMSTKAGCRRWPLAVFYNILDLAGVNSWILFKKATGSNIHRRKFMMQLSAQLRGDLLDDQEDPVPAPLHNLRQGRPDAGQHVGPNVPRPPPMEKRVNCLVRSHCTKNRTVNSCVICQRPVCGKCLATICSRCVPQNE